MKIEELVWVVVESSGRGQEVFVDFEARRSEALDKLFAGRRVEGGWSAPRCAQGQS